MKYRNRVLAVGSGLVLGVFVSSVILASYGIGPRDIIHRLRSTRETSVFGIHQLDDRIGYGHQPNATGHHQTRQFDVEYHIGAMGSRRVPGFSSDRPQVLVLGDSWTFGHGLAGHETYPAQLQRRWPTRGVRNLGVMGYGTSHVLLTLERALERALERDENIVLVLYGWTPIHLARTYLRRSNLSRTASGRTPWLAIENRELVYKGLASIDDAIEDHRRGLGRTEWNLTLAATRRMSEIAEAHGARFVFVVLPGSEHNQIFGQQSRRMARRLRRIGLQTMDLQADPGFPKTENLFIPDDGHPNARWNELVAESIAARLDPLSGFERRRGNERDLDVSVPPRATPPHPPDLPSHGSPP